jgi:uncharacterized SAM-binding protein YcdF (DUF218 family)
VPLETIAKDMNVLAGFLGVRDTSSLTPEALGGPVDVMALFGGSILAGGDVLAEAMRAGVARAYVIVGGAGHTTETFRRRARELCPSLDFADDAPEAEVFAACLRQRHGLEVDLLETRSTNCGNNITYLRDLLAERGVACHSLVLSQDATMQRRMAAIAQKEMPGVRVINYATYQARVVVEKGADGPSLCFDSAPLGMWDMERYRSLLMGEVPRLTDNEGGYGPAGAGFLAHVDVPDEVTAAWCRLCEAYPDSVRAANPAFAS